MNKLVMIIKGKVVPGLGKGAFFMQLPDYVKQFHDLLGFAPFAGTLNIQTKEVNKLDEVLASKFITIKPMENYCAAKMLPCKLNDHECYILKPGKTEHEDIVEIIDKEKLRDKLNIKDNDEVSIEF